MRAVVRVIVVVALAFGLASCGGSKFKRYNGPPVTFIVVDKSDRKMWLLSGSRVLRDFDIELGGNPVGHKQFEGDLKTPEGTYVIDRRNPNSRYHLSLGISYPNDADRAFAASQNRPPGGDIFIHGRGETPGARRPDWTAGCIAVKDREIEDIYAMVRTGTPIQIRP
jgi:murein L,D-transpeptidase YafK